MGCRGEELAKRTADGQENEQADTAKKRQRRAQAAPMTEEVSIRIADVEDGAELLEIYRPYVERTAITFEYEAPSVAEFSERIAHVLKRYPYLVAEGAEGWLLGYAYAGTFHDRAAYDWAVETSIYVRMDQRGRGIGRLLHEALERALALQGIRNMNACIAYPEQEDEYLTRDSVRFHEHFQYRMVGEFRQCGYKFHRWYNMVWMEKHIGDHVPDQPPVKLFCEVRDQVEEELRFAAGHQGK